MAIIETINSAINSFVWGVPMLVLLVGAGILLTCRTCGVQFRKFGYAMKNTAGKIFKKGEAKEGEITPFQAMSTALAGTVGTGNIAGVTTALTLGGPGSMFWLWITALIGMATKYSEVLLAVKFRERNKDGDWVGGPMYYIKNGLGKNWKWLGAIFCIFAALAAFGIGNAVQVGNITSSINTVITSFSPDFAGQKMVNNHPGHPDCDRSLWRHQAPGRCHRKAGAFHGRHLHRGLSRGRGLLRQDPARRVRLHL